MAKIGYEVEGKLKNCELLTLFMSADEYMYDGERLAQVVVDNQVQHVYISDHLNTLDLYRVEEELKNSGLTVTIELTQLDSIPPEGIEIFWNVSQASYAQSRTLRYLRPKDQIKVENEKTVLSWSVSDCVVTLPDEFEGDREV